MALLSQKFVVRHAAITGYKNYDARVASDGVKFMPIFGTHTEHGDVMTLQVFSLRNKVG
jgi:hypothetical protein